MPKIKKFQGGTWGVGLSPIAPKPFGGNTAAQQSSLNSFSNFQQAQIMPKMAGLPDNLFQSFTGPKTLTSSSIMGGTRNSNSIDAKSGLGAIGGMLGGVYDAIPTADKSLNENDESMANIRATANKALLSGAAGPWGMAAGAVNMAIDKTGGFTDGSKGLGGSTDTLNSIAALAVPGAGWFTKKTNDYKMSDTLKQSTSYTGTANNAKTAQQNAGAKLLFGQSKANNMIGTAKMQDTKVQGITENAQMNFNASNNPLLALGTQLQLGGGYQQGGMRAGKSGLKINREFAQKILSKRNTILPSEGFLKTSEEVAEFKEGGSINVIPEGALHAHKHHLDDVDEKFEDVTCKGIPVVTESEGGNITQHAEVERNEIIFCLDVTQQLEKLMKEGSDDAAITAGQLLVHEILENTEDKTGLIQEVD